MTDRRNCETCACWSDLIAKAVITDHGCHVEALCVSTVSLKREQYTSAKQSCSDWAAPTTTKEA